MNVQEQIDRYVSDQPQPKRDDMRALHARILSLSPGCQLWFLDGRNDDGKVVSNPSIGYGVQTIDYSNGKGREFYQVGVSANTSGISVYLIGLKDRKYLAETYGAKLGKAKVTGYCIAFRTLQDIDVDVLSEIVANHMAGGSAPGSKSQP